MQILYDQYNSTVSDRIIPSNVCTCNNQRRVRLVVIYLHNAHINFWDLLSLNGSLLILSACDDPKHTYYDGSCYVHQTSSMSFFHHEDEARSLYGPQAKIVSINSEAEARSVTKCMTSFDHKSQTLNRTWRVRFFVTRECRSEPYRNY